MESVGEPRDVTGKAGQLPHPLVLGEDKGGTHVGIFAI